MARGTAHAQAAVHTAAGAQCGLYNQGYSAVPKLKDKLAMQKKIKQVADLAADIIVNKTSFFDVDNKSR